jgi:hypothetical protein
MTTGLLGFANLAPTYNLALRLELGSFPQNPAPVIRLFTPITPASFFTLRVVFGLPFALLAVYAGELLVESLTQTSYGFSTTGR